MVARVPRTIVVSNTRTCIPPEGSGRSRDQRRKCRRRDLETENADGSTDAGRRSACRILRSDTQAHGGRAAEWLETDEDRALSRSWRKCRSDGFSPQTALADGMNVAGPAGGDRVPRRCDTSRDHALLGHATGQPGVRDRQEGKDLAARGVRPSVSRESGDDLPMRALKSLRILVCAERTLYASSARRGRCSSPSQSSDRREPVQAPRPWAIRSPDGSHNAPTRHRQHSDHRR